MTPLMYPANIALAWLVWCQALSPLFTCLTAASTSSQVEALSDYQPLLVHDGSLTYCPPVRPYTVMVQ